MTFARKCQNILLELDLKSTFLEMLILFTHIVQEKTRNLAHFFSTSCRKIPFQIIPKKKMGEKSKILLDSDRLQNGECSSGPIEETIVDLVILDFQKLLKYLVTKIQMGLGDNLLQLKSLHDPSSNIHWPYSPYQK